jgi:hypothetical protein
MSFSICATSETSFDITEDYNVYLCDCSTGNMSIYLPDLSYDGLRVYVKRVDSSGNSMTLFAPTGNYIDGQTSKVISAMTCLSVINYSGNWFVLSLT